MKLAERVTQITPSATMAVKRAADELKRRGVDVIDLGPGEPDFPTPEHIKRAAQEALAQNFTKYTAETGIWELRDAIAQKYNREYRTHYTAENVLVTSGAKQALYNIAAALLEPGDEVLIPIPYWVSFPEQIKLVGAKPVLIQPKGDFQVSADLIKEYMTQRTKALILNSPNNPAGVVLDRKQLQKIVELAQHHRLWVIYDECYEKFLYEGEHVSVVECDTERAIAVSSASKTYAMTGWRIGWSVAPKELTQAMAAVQSHTTSHPSSISQKAAVAALTGDQSCVQQMLAEYRKRREFVLRELRAIDGIEFTVPQGAFFVFPNVERFFNEQIKNSVDLARFLLERHHVAVVPGAAFGAEGYMRISYATSLEQLREGLKRLREGLAQLYE
ncbi:Aspartate aminotransferase [bacterium HR07]|uniref:Aminotransferase n=2 Tax=Candidatus Bipolaricaulota TaxID=67810 RepID=H5S8Y9_9BACT|nr:aspartate aminotransferase [uncultured Acetothermia bacterium]BAL52625.1 aspartate aminotransferase [uncultured Acetothermia bacterium]BAL59616.1 aspartate aminotransferase [Candidatus Acetothermum autotrophicum]GBC75978.1 Aspartate aminotransferase [bacterium HR07]